MKDICKRGKKKKTQPKKTPKTQPKGLQGQSAACCPWRVPPQLPKDPQLAQSHCTSLGQGATPGLGCTVAWAGASLSRAGPTRGCRVTCRHPELLGGQPPPHPKHRQPQGWSKPFPGSAAPGVRHRGGPSKPPGDEGALSQGTRVSAEPEMGDKDWGGRVQGSHVPAAPRCPPRSAGPSGLCRRCPLPRCGGAARGTHWRWRQAQSSR